MARPPETEDLEGADDYRIKHAIPEKKKVKKMPTGKQEQKKPRTFNKKTGSLD